MRIKNFWSLNVDEAVVADKIKEILEKQPYEIFFPVNTRLKNIDLILYNLKTTKSLSIQVKGSITYRGNSKKSSKGMRKYGEPHSWSRIKSSSIFDTVYHIDFIIFVIYKDELSKANREIRRDFLVIPMDEFRKHTKQKAVGSKGEYNYYFVVKEKKVLEIREKDNKIIDFSKYLNNFGLLSN